MKTIQRGIVLISFSFICLCGNAVTKTWAGPAASNWNDGVNWLPAGVPAAGDDIIFSSSASVTIDISSPIELNSLHFINNCIVVFDCNSTKNFRLASTSLLYPAFYIEAGSTFTFDATNTGINNSTLDLTVSPGSIGSINGTLIISCTGGAANGPKLDTYNSATEYGVVTVNTGGIIRILPDADNTESSLIPVPTIVMATGSVYENLKNGGSFPEGVWALNSLARALSPGPIGPTFNGTSYGNLEWNCASQTAFAFLNKDISFNNVNFISTNSSDADGEFRIKTSSSAGIWIMTINGNLSVGADARLVTTAANVAAGNGGYIHVKGNIINQGAITSSGLLGTFSDFQITGTTLQTFSNTGMFSGSYLLFTMVNPAGLTLLTALTLPWNADFVDGKITTTSSNILTMVNDATYTGGSVDCFIEGPMKKIGDDPFDFPVGEGGIYAPIGMSNGMNAAPTDEFTAQYFRQSPQTTYGMVYEPPIDHVSYVEFWTLSRVVGTASKQVTLTVNEVSFAKVGATLLVARHDGTLLWRNEGLDLYAAGPPAPPYITGTVRSNIVNDFGPFTLSTTDAGTINPLPIIFISFTAQKSNDDGLLKWKLAEIPVPDISFDVEGSADGRNFRKIGSVDAANASEYRFTDFDLPPGISYYRIKAKEPDGKIVISAIAAIVNEENGIYITQIYPNPVKDMARLKLLSAKASITEFVVFDMVGRVIKQFRLEVPEGNSAFDIYIGSLPGGSYFIRAFESGSGSSFARFIKQ